MKWLLRALVVLLTAASVWTSLAYLWLSADLSALFPHDPKSAALARYARVFGGGDVALVLVRAETPDEAERTAEDVAHEISEKASVAHVVSHAPAAVNLDPTLAWRYAGPAARAKLAHALTPEGMRARLEETRAMLLAPGSAAAQEMLARDPLRLSSIPFEARAELVSGVAGAVDSPFTADQGRARLVLLVPRGNAFESGAVAALVGDVNAAFAQVRARHPHVRLGLAGGHAIAQATESMLRRDLTVSGTVSLALAALVFLAIFRRARALVAVLPPLALGTVWTTGLAALLFDGIHAIAIAFAAVVVGVGVDTGVHVYAALLDARRAGKAPREAAVHARRATWRPTMAAAGLAGAAFASVAWTDLSAMKELGILCGLGEVLTAIAILAVTPELGAWLERGPPPPARNTRLINAIQASTRTRARALGTLVAAAAIGALLLAIGWPTPGTQIVAIRPRALDPIATSDEIYRLFGGQPGQWIVLSTDANREESAARADAVAEALESLANDASIAGFDALATFGPAPATQRARLAARDALDLPALRPRLEHALLQAGFDLETCAPALLAFSAPAHDIAPLPTSQEGALGWLVARHLQADAGETLAVTYVRPSAIPASDARALAMIRAADPRAIVTGYGELENALRATLGRDLPRVALLVLVVVALGLRAVLGRARDVVLALGVLGVEIAMLGLAMRALGVTWHVYDALVVPVLLGITIDEAMFLLHAARTHASADEALRVQAPLVATTALSTAAGFAALLACRFEGLRDLGAVGSLGSVAGLIAVLAVIPAGLRLARGPVR